MEQTKSATGLRRWAAAAKLGSVVEYHRGHLAADCARGGVAGNADLQRLRQAASELQDAGAVTLAQTRHDGESFSYRAIRVAAVVALLWAAPGQAHDWYTTLQEPGTGWSCCGGHDCAPRDPCSSPGIPDGLLIDGVCYPIDPAKVLPIASPDGLDHACKVPAESAPRCFVLGPRV